MYTTRNLEKHMCHSSDLSLSVSTMQPASCRKSTRLKLFVGSLNLSTDSPSLFSSPFPPLLLAAISRKCHGNKASLQSQKWTRHIHQIWNDKNIPAKFQSAVQHCRDINPGYKYSVWTPEERSEPCDCSVAFTTPLDQCNPFYVKMFSVFTRTMQVTSKMTCESEGSVLLLHGECCSVQVVPSRNTCDSVSSLALQARIAGAALLVASRHIRLIRHRDVTHQRRQIPDLVRVRWHVP